MNLKIAVNSSKLATNILLNAVCRVEVVLSFLYSPKSCWSH